MAVTRVGLFAIAMLVARPVGLRVRQRDTAPAETPELEALRSRGGRQRPSSLPSTRPSCVGETSRFAIHLTRLDTFKPLLDGRVEVRLEGGGPVEVFATDAPSRPGIFGVDVRPTRAGTRTLVIELKARGLIDVHRIDGVTVHPTVDTAKGGSGRTGRSPRHQFSQGTAVEPGLRHGGGDHRQRFGIRSACRRASRRDRAARRTCSRRSMAGSSRPTTLRWAPR